MSDSTAFDYLHMRDVGDRLLTKFGQSCLLRKVTNTGGPAWEPVQANQDYPTIVAIVPLPRWYPSFTQGDVLRTDRMGLIAAGPLTALGVVATAFDRIIDASGFSWQIVDLKSIAPSGVVVFYQTQLRI